MTIVYTTIFGGSDSLKPAPEGADRCVCFMDREPEDPMGWEVFRHTAFTDPRREAWSFRCIPHKTFPDHTISVWIDGSFTLTNLDSLLFDAGPYEISALRHHKRSSCYAEGHEIVRVGQGDAGDVGQQLAAYRAEHFEPTHLSISCIIVRTNLPTVKAFNETWDREIRKYRGDNTQLSLDYSAWKNGLEIHALKGSRHNNPYAIHDHEDHKKRRRPYEK